MRATNPVNNNVSKQNEENINSESMNVNNFWKKKSKKQKKNTHTFQRLKEKPNLKTETRRNEGIKAKNKSTKKKTKQE